MKSTLLTFSLLLVFACPIFGQVPITTQVQILKAEDARRFDSVLEGLMKSPNAEVRVRAVLAAGRIGDDASIPALASLLENDESNRVQEMAAFALGEIESIKAADTILKTLKKIRDERNLALMTEEVANGTMETASNRTNATRAVANLADVTARLIEACGKIAAANPKDERSKTLGEEIIRALSYEQKTLAKPSIEVIRLGLTAVLRARPAGAEARVQWFLAFTDPNIVADALNTLTRLRAKNANRDARDLLETHMHAIVRANAARLLGAAEDKEAVDLLIKAATKDVDSRVRVSAIRSLAALKDQKAADPLLARGEELFAAYSKAKKPNLIPDEQSEFVEIATALGRLLANTDNARADKLFADFGKLDKGHTPEVYIARVRIGPKRGEGKAPELVNWRQYSTLAQVVGEFAAIEPTSEVGKQMKAEAPAILRPLAKAITAVELDDAMMIMAAPDVLSAFARFKTDDLGEVARLALQNKDVFIRTTAAGILGDLPSSKENVDALKSAFTKALLTDKKENDAQLAMLDAMFKLDKKESVGTLLVALSAPDYLVRRSALDKLLDADLQKDFPGVSTSIENARKGNKNKVLPYSAAFGTKLGQVLNTDVDYRRALSRKNGSISAVLTTEKGSFTIEFLPEEAPLTVDNFVKLARAGYFNGLEVHRVVPNFVMQDGDPRGDGNGGPGWSIRCEVNMVPYERGAVGMALSGKDTGGSQWFVTHSPQPHLDGGYTVFGRVNSKGMEVVDKIVRGDKILSVRIVGR